MTVGHVGYSASTQHGALLHSAAKRFGDAFSDLNEILQTMAQMVDGDGSSTTHFPYMTSKFGFTDDATAKAGYEEMNSVLAKLNGDGSVTNVNAAIVQFLARFR